MKNKLFYTLTLGLLFTGCTDMLETYPNGQIDDEEMVKFQNYVSGLIGYSYEQLPRDYRNIEGNRLDCATDDGVLTNVSDNVVRLATGVINNSQDPFSSLWTKWYKAIANINLAIDDNLIDNTDYYYDDEINDYYKRLLKGEAYGMRAYLQWQLLKYWGGRGIDSHELLGFPIITEKITVNSENINRKRNTYAECVAQIQEDCDSAYKYLPLAHRDFLVPADKRTLLKKVAGSVNWGRIDGITIKAILADMYLTYASPLFNPENDQERWKLAADYAYDVIKFKEETDGSVSGGFKWNNKLNWFDACSPNAIFISRRAGTTDANDDLEKDFYPAGFRGNGVMGATHELMAAFPKADGSPWDGSLDNPFENRDARLAAVLFYPNSVNAKAYTFDTWVNAATGERGKDCPGLPQVSRTGYHIKKMVFPDLNWNDKNVKKAAHMKFFYRWETMMLIFAEAASEYDGPETTKWDGITPKEALRRLRARQTYDGTTNSYSNNDTYLNVAAQDPDKFRELVHNERRIELCFEGTRFWDIRRWAKSVDEINKPVHMINTRYVGDDGENKKFEYSISEVENRNFPSLYIPIPYKEILKADKLEQNEGWNTWSK